MSSWPFTTNLPYDLANIQLRAYQYPNSKGVTTPFPWTWKDEVAHPHLGTTITAGLYSTLDGDQIVVMPGTGGEATPEETKRQWVLNFAAIPEPQPHNLFGWVYFGFYFDIERFTNALRLRLDKNKPIYGTGHSRGAAQITYVAGLLKSQGFKIAGITCWESPRPGGEELATYLADIPSLSTQCRGVQWPYRDLVCDVPVKFPLLPEPKHICPLMDLNVVPAPHDPWGIWCYHHMQLVNDAVQKCVVSPLGETKS